jgi:hypothetical protein
LLPWENTQYLCFKIFDPDGNLVEVFSDEPVPLTVCEKTDIRSGNDRVADADATAQMWRVLEQELQQPQPLKAIETLLQEKGLIKLRKEAKPILERFLADGRVIKKAGKYAVTPQCDLFASPADSGCDVKE